MKPKWTNLGPKMDPKSTQNRSQERSNFSSNFRPLLESILERLGPKKVRMKAQAGEGKKVRRQRRGQSGGLRGVDQVDQDIDREGFDAPDSTAGGAAAD